MPFSVFRANLLKLGFAVRSVAGSSVVAVIACLVGLPAAANAADDTFSCLSELYGPLADVQGTVNVNNDWFNLGEGTRLDARADIFTSKSFPDNIAQYPVDIRTAQSNICWAGGAVYSTNPLEITWRQSKEHKGDGIDSHNNNLIVDGARIHNAHDGFVFWSKDWPRPEVYWQIRNSWITYNRDDCIENDWDLGGLVEDSLFDGCYVFLSTRGDHNANNTVTVRNSLIRMQQMPGPYYYDDDPSVMGHGEIFKTDTTSVSYALENNIFLVEGLVKTSADPSVWPAQNVYALGFKDKVTSCSNNVIVWLGPGEFPGNIPADPSCVTVTTDRTVWDNARAAWLAEHPLVARIDGVDEPVPDPAPVPEPIPEPIPEPAPEPDSTLEPAPDTTDQTMTTRKSRTGFNSRDKQSPTVDIISPVKGAKVFPSTSVWVEIDAFDNVDVVRLEVYIDNGTPHVFAGNGTHGFAWIADNSTIRHVIKARAYDESGNSSSERTLVYTIQ